MQMNNLLVKLKEAWVKVKEAYKTKENKPIGARFIGIMEIIYALVLAVGVVKIVEVFEVKDVKLEIYFSILISILVLVRFFFAPSKNVKIVGEHGKGWKWSIMLFDVPVLMAHSFIYYYMCYKIFDVYAFYKWFFVLLIVNSVWLFTIWIRLRNKPIAYIKVWSISNLIFFCLYLGTFKMGLAYWIPWFLLSLLNSLIDLLTTYSDYFQD